MYIYKLIKNSNFFLLNGFISQISFFYFYKLIIDQYGIDFFGTFSYIQNIASLFILFALFGLPIYSIRKLSTTRGRNIDEEIIKINSLKLITSFISLFLYFFVIGYMDVDNELKILGYIFGAEIFLQIFLFDWFFHYKQKINYLFYARLASCLILIISALGILNLSTSKYPIALAIVFYSFSYIFIVLIFFYKHINKTLLFKKYFSIDKNLLKQSFFVFVSLLVSFLLFNNGIYFTESNLSKDDLGIFSVFLKCLILVTGIIGSFYNAFFPAISKLSINRKIYKEISLIHLKIILKISIPFFIFFYSIFPNMIISFFNINENYLFIFNLLAFLLLINFINTFFGRGLWTLGKNNYVFYSLLISLFVSLSINLRYIDFGLAVPCISLIVAEIIAFFPQFYFFKKYSGIFISYKIHNKKLFCFNIAMGLIYFLIIFLINLGLIFNLVIFLLYVTQFIYYNIYNDLLNFKYLVNKNKNLMES